MLAETLTIAALPNQNLTFHAVTCGDALQMEERHPCARHLLSPHSIETYSHYPGAHRDFPIFFYLETNGQVASYMRTIPDEITIDGIRRPWAWTADNYTDSQFRNCGLSTTLQAKATKYLHSQGVGRGSVFSTEVTLHIFEKLGFTLVGYAPRHLLLRSLLPVIEAHVGQRVLRRAAQTASTPFMSAALGILRFWQRLLTTNTCREQVIPDDERIRELCAQATQTVRLSFNSSAELLTKKLEIAGRIGECKLWLISTKSPHRGLSYFITRERKQTQPLAGKYSGFRLMTMLDFGMCEGDIRAANAIAFHLIDVFFQSNCDVLEMISSNRLVNHAAARRGLIRVGKGMSFNYCVPVDWDLQANFASVENWPLTAFRGDAFCF